jgi:tetratricopeptide (TPR) repeat protein
MADARRVLEFSPGNFHALANLTRYLFLSGQCDEARVVAELLKSAESVSPDLFMKQAEALAMLGDWQGILETLDRAEEQNTDKRGADLGLLYHLAGVAAAESGEFKLATRHWKRAVKMKTAADWAQENLDDLKSGPAEQTGPWAFPFEYWIPRAVVDRYIAEIERGGQSSRANVHRQARKFFELYPSMEKLAPVLLQRGDPTAKEFMVRLASLSELPSVLSALREFAFGRRGADQLRYSAAMRLLEAGAIEPGRQRMWINGEQRDIDLMTVAISSEPMAPLPKDVQSLAARAWEAIHDGEGAAAEAILDQARKRWPDDPSLAFNRAVAIQLQGRGEEAMSIVRELYARHPDYSFARIKLAEEATERHDFEAARELLAPLLSRHSFHQSEYTALCHANIGLCVAQKEMDSARHWLMMWENAAPDDERPMYWHARLKPGWLGRLLQ